MISIVMNQKATDLLVDVCPLGISQVGVSLPGMSLLATGMSGAESARPASLAGFAVRERNERPTQAPAVATEAHASGDITTNGAGFHQQYVKQYTWAHRGLPPWRDSA
ncbi:hypothetical protein ACFV3R_13340 [Streptomyces sp. NPDC059740]|uniref:hypothetical protein n=1 Tax=Streptomyces sp. NPDC059740 TaxID=3346926 RepID=UPI00364EA705